MKRNLLLTFLAAGLLLTCNTSCKDDETTWKTVDGAEPTLTLSTSNIRTEAGRSITIAAKIHDADGISTIKLLCPEISLNKVIDIIAIYGEPLTDYDLEYTHKCDQIVAPESRATIESAVIEVSVTDIAGNVTTQTTKLTFDGDFTKPVFIAAPTGQETVMMEDETPYQLEFCVTDNIGLDKVIVDITEYDMASEESGVSIDGFPMEFDAMGDDTFEYSDKVILPSAPADYKLTIIAYDLPAQDGDVRTATASAVLTVTGSVDFAKMYLADVPASELSSDVFGVPMRVDRIGECQYRARYYNEEANTEIYFLGQKGAYTPVCYGIDPKNENRLINSAKTVKPIVLPEEGKYYEINYNTETGEYDFHTYEVTSEMEPIPSRWEYGGYWLNTWQNWDLDSQPGVLLNKEGDWWAQDFYFGAAGGPGDIKARFYQDKNNPHRFYSDPVHYDAGEQLSFIIHNWHSHGWWNYCSWGVDDSAECDIFLYLGVCDKNYLDWLFPDRNVTIEDWKNWIGSDGFRKGWQYADGSDKWAKPTVITSGNYKYIFDSHLGRCKLVRE